MFMKREKLGFGYHKKLEKKIWINAVYIHIHEIEKKKNNNNKKKSK